MNIEYKPENIPANQILQFASMGIVDLKLFRLYRAGKKTDLTVTLSVNEMKGKTDLAEGVRHLSIYCSDRVPSIRELYQAKNHFYPELEMALYMMPKISEPVNHHSVFEVKKAVNNFQKI